MTVQPGAAMLILECYKYRSTLLMEDPCVYVCVDPNLRENTRDAVADHIEYLGWYQGKTSISEEWTFCHVDVIFCDIMNWVPPLLATLGPTIYYISVALSTHNGPVFNQRPL